MRAAVMYGAGDVRVETVSDPTIQEPTDAIVRIVAGCICGSDLWPYASKEATEHGARMGHEFVGVVEELLPLVLDGTIEPGRVFDRTIGLDGVPEGYQAMADRTALKVLIRP